MTTQHDTKPADLARVLSWRPTPEPFEGYAPANSREESAWYVYMVVGLLVWVGFAFGLNYAAKQKNAAISKPIERIEAAK
jgi:hypothetical protein